MFGGSTPQKKFLKAAANGDVAALNLSLTRDVPSAYSIETRDGSGRTALILAARAGKVDTLKILIEKKGGSERRGQLRPHRPMVGRPEKQYGMREAADRRRRAIPYPRL